MNNAGRSIRRSVDASTDRLHDYERVMAVNYFGAVRMVLALLPHWRERRFGHVVNVSSAGVQANSPRYSAYLPSKAALDAFADVVSTETLSDHITFTTIHMPLVATPMITPSKRLNPMPAISAEHAAAMVVRGLVDKPVRIDTPLGTLSDIGHYFTPKLSRRVLHQLYLGYPDSAAARGDIVSRSRRRTARIRRPSTAPERRPQAAAVRASCGCRAGQAGGAPDSRCALVTGRLIDHGVTGCLAGHGPTALLPVFADVDTGVDDAMALVYLLASHDADWWGSPRPAATSRWIRFASTTSACSSCVGAADIPVSKGADGLWRAAAHRRGHPWPAGLGYAELPPDDAR